MRHAEEAIIAKGLTLPLYMRDIQAGGTHTLGIQHSSNKRRANPEHICMYTR
jgi:hypothetical protein